MSAVLDTAFRIAELEDHAARQTLAMACSLISLIDLRDHYTGGHSARVAEYCRSPCANVVDIFVAIHVPHTRAFGFVDEERLTAHGAKRAHRRVHTTRDVFQRFGKQRFGFRT